MQNRPRAAVQGLPLVVLLAAVFAPRGDAALGPGHLAPPFDLPPVDGGDYVQSAELFSSHAHTFLVLWDSGCPHCVQSLAQCQAFHEEHQEIGIVGIHTEEGDTFEILEIVETAGISFPQLQDQGGGTWQRYGAPLGTFSVVLVDRRGMIADYRVDPDGDLRAVLEDMLPAGAREGRELPGMAAATAADSAVSGTAAPGFVFHGNQRLRYLGIDAQGGGATGPYGEAVQPGSSFLFRYELEMMLRINRRLLVGGLLRISNEDEEVLLGGPKYLGAEWGSAFAEMSGGRASLRLGYYEISMTPLTLMRWDWDDNPRIGGDAGCGCGAAAGVLLIDSLEELAPELVFEGAVAKYTHPTIETRAFYAIPRRPTEIRYPEHVDNLVAGRARAPYSLEIYGFESRWRRRDSRTGSSWKASIHLTGSWENHRSVNFAELGYPPNSPPAPWHTSTTASLAWRVPVVRSLGLEGEWIAWNRAKESGVGAELDTDDLFATGTAGIVFSRGREWRVRGDYVRLAPGFYSPFAALSYASNREGPRVSARLPLRAETAAVTLFYKKLWEIDRVEPAAEKLNDTVVGGSLDAETNTGLGGNVGWMQDESSREGAIEALHETRKVLLVAARYRLAKESLLKVEYQRVTTDITNEAQHAKSRADFYSIYLKANF